MAGPLDHPDVLGLFADQFGVADTAQLVARNVSPRTIGRARQRGTLVPVLRGVHRLASSPVSFRGRAMAVQLHVGPDSFLTGTTAGALYGLKAMPMRTIQVAIPVSVRTMLPTWVRSTRTNWINSERDVVVRSDGLRVAAPLRMLVDLASTFDDHRFERAAEGAWHLGLVSPREAADYLPTIRRKGRPGVARFARWLEDAAGRTRPAQSGMEVRFARAVEAAGLPAPVRQHRVTLPDGSVIHLDLAWPAVRLAIEPGHSWWHGGDMGKRKDEARDRACSAIGWQVERYDEAAMRDIDAAASEIVAIYSQRAAFFDTA